MAATRLTAEIFFAACLNRSATFDGLSSLLSAATGDEWLPELRSSDRAESCERLMLARRLGLPAPGPPCINPKTDIVRTKPPTTAPSSCSRKK